MTPPRPTNATRLAGELSRLLWREGMYPTLEDAKRGLLRLLRPAAPQTWTCDVVAEAYLLLRERLDAEVARGERPPHGHPAGA